MADDNMFALAKSKLYASVFAPSSVSKTRVLYTTVVVGKSANSDTSTNGPVNISELRDSFAQKATIDGTTRFSEASGTSSTNDGPKKHVPNDPSNPNPTLTPSTISNVIKPPSPPLTQGNPTALPYQGYLTTHSNANPTSYSDVKHTTTSHPTDVIPTASHTITYPTSSRTHTPLYHTPSRTHWTMPLKRDIYDSGNAPQLRSEQQRRLLAVRTSCREFSTAIEYDLHQASPPDRSNALTILISYVQSLAALLDNADVLLVTIREWPICYPPETEWLFNIFGAYSTSTPAKAFEGPTVITFYQDMHEEFVRDWLPEVQALHDHLNLLADEVADARPSLFTLATGSLPFSIDGSNKAQSNSARRRVTIAVGDARSDESSELNEQSESGEEIDLSRGIDGD